MEESSRILYIPKAILSLLDKGEFKAYEMPTGNRFCCLTHDLSILFGKPINLVFSHLLDNAHKHRKMGGRGCIPLSWTEIQKYVSFVKLSCKSSRHFLTVLQVSLLFRVESVQPFKIPSPPTPHGFAPICSSS